MDPTNIPPRWITPAYCIALVCVIGILAGVAVSEMRRSSLPPGSDIADVTVNLGGIPVREHCTTCHPDGDRKQNVPHPEIHPHEPAELGCTGCHLGEGMALDLTVSHGLPGNGARVVLNRRTIQASCYRCHPLQPLTGAEQAWQGYRLFLQKACDSCHPLAGLQQSGRYGPDLSAVGDHLGVTQLVEAIREPDREPLNSLMPRYPLSKRQARKIAIFLKSRTARPLFQTPLAQLRKKELPRPDDLFPGQENLPPGKALLVTKRCTACHRYDKEDGRIGPDLTFIGLLRPTDFLRAFSGNPTAYISEARMPAIRLTRDEKRLLVDELRRSARNARRRLAKAKDGRDIYMLLCQRCHAADGNGQGPIAANLAQRPRPFAGNRSYFAFRSDDELKASLKDGVPGTSMPGFGKLLDEEQREKLIDLLFEAFIGGGRFTKHPRATLPPRPETDPPAAVGRALFGKHCSRCHGRNGNGHGPDADGLTPRPRNLTNRFYVAARSDRQLLRAIAYGIPGSAMPQWSRWLDDGELWALVHQVRRIAEGKEP